MENVLQNSREIFDRKADDKTIMSFDSLRLSKIEIENQDRLYVFLKIARYSRQPFPFVPITSPFDIINVINRTFVNASSTVNAERTFFGRLKRVDYFYPAIRNRYFQLNNNLTN